MNEDRSKADQFLFATELIASDILDFTLFFTASEGMSDIVTNSLQSTISVFEIRFLYLEICFLINDSLPNILNLKSIFRSNERFKPKHISETFVSLPKASTDKIYFFTYSFHFHLVIQ